MVSIRKSISFMRKKLNFCWTFSLGLAAPLLQTLPLPWTLTLDLHSSICSSRHFNLRFPLPLPLSSPPFSICIANRTHSTLSAKPSRLPSITCKTTTVKNKTSSCLFCLSELCFTPSSKLAVAVLELLHTSVDLQNDRNLNALHSKD